MEKILGDFIKEFPPEHDSLELTFTPSSQPQKKRWKNNRLSAYFLADYFSSFLPLDDDQRRVAESKASVSYIANELLENAIKFHDQSVNCKVMFGIHFIQQPDHSIVAAIFATNTVQSQTLISFEEFIDQLLNADLEELYIDQVEKSLEEDSNASGLGLISMMKDYGATLGWKITDSRAGRDFVSITTMAKVKV
ncbi:MULTISPECIES: DUF6272 family protein [unclassified Roseofilum]|uniref:DUF6272 family protein n=1 Tax=unclassified Roseofilum TaxID=2620099 RepID=UPI000E893B00|nr:MULTISPECIES: DUF6272 family protein [unclassified Roseofilum]MBP0009961.1 ATP-binding protein [Roseofilum sp. Belize Diploria]MBP0034357.1 ATP-binding protein [Roseofilum sp. Belize BBD 4]HBQ99617.1 ATP-binding protein [Cyanobacteria bacterium UBA11691]